MKKWVVGIGAVLLCSAAVVVCIRFIGKARLARKIAELKAQGIPTSFSELEVKYKLPEGIPNAADIYLKAFAAYKPLADAEKEKLLPVMGIKSEPNANEPYPAEQMAAAKEFIEQNQEMFRLLHEAGLVKECFYPIDFSQDSFPQNKYLNNIKKSCQSLMMAVIYYSQTNQPQKAYQALVDQIRLGELMLSGPCLIDHLVRLAVFAIEVAGIQEINNQTILDETQLRQLQERFQQIERAATIAPALTGGICSCLEYRQYNCNFLSERVRRFAAKCFPQSIIGLLEGYQQLIESEKLPIQKQMQKAREITEEATRGGSLSMSPLVFPAVKKVYEIHLRVRANMACAITALAVERYRLKEGYLPESVEELVPGYLEHVYIDPFDGKPLRYKQTNPGYMIYTIGPDGVDNGGQEENPNRHGGNLDWAFKVYR